MPARKPKRRTRWSPGGGGSQATVGQGSAVCSDDRSLEALSDGVVGRGALESLSASNENVDRHVAAAH